ncbi:sodium:solute symporter [Chlorobium sp. BLA1]|uniref:sodium:solute symporter n=1 Tax=Candidatus Chlorobium masyuteum TaxID=2716876 RepID=UPI00141E77D8|nr:sodium:solute symporter [Candidatus Chlorobium masyuteum]NHQ59770.1 sodium:solute symporter [Candidatus Chlorobium masyuteum]
MQPIDLAIIVLFLAGNTLFGLWHGKSNKSSKDYFLGNHNLPWIVSMLSIVASETSVLTFVSVPGLAYRGDWTFLQLAMGYIVGRVLVSLILLPMYFKHGVSSIYEIIGLRYGPGMQKVAAIVFLVTRTLGDAIRFLAAGVVVQVVTGWSLPLAVMIIGVVTLVYTLSGGIKAVVWLESFQFSLYLLGGILSIVFLLQSIDQGLPSIISSLLAAGKLNIINTDPHILTNPLTFISAFIGGILLSLSSHGVDYMMVQRVLGCKDLRSARKAMIGSGFFVFFQFSVFLFAGSLISVFMHDAPMEKDREFAFFIVHHLPAGLKGLLIAGVLSAAMSTHSSAINSLASSTVNDILGGKGSLGFSRVISLFWAVLLIIIALLFDTGSNAIVMVGLEIASFTYGGLLGLFLLSKSKRNFHAASLGAGLIASMGIVFVLKFMGLAWTWYISVSVLVNLLVTIGVDLIFFSKKDQASQ